MLYSKINKNINSGHKKVTKSTIRIKFINLIKNENLVFMLVLLKLSDFLKPKKHRMKSFHGVDSDSNSLGGTIYKIKI